MPDIVIHFTKGSRNMTALVPAPLAVRFTNKNDKKRRVIVPADGRVTAIFLDGEPPGVSATREKPSEVALQDDVGQITTDNLTAAFAAGDSGDQSGPGICYQVGPDVFCW